MTPIVSQRVKSGGEVIMTPEQIMGAVAGAITAIVGVLVTAFFGLRKTLIEKASEQNQAFFEELGDRLSDVESELKAERAAVYELRTGILESKEIVSQLEAKNRLLRENVETEEARNRLLLSQNAELAEKCDLLKAQLDEARFENKDLRRTLVVLEGRMSGLEFISDMDHE